MEQNVGGIDRVVRLIAGAALIGLSVAGVIGWWGWLGVVPILGALVGWCPVYRLLGIKTN
ncbi:YgaP family membrane protein [Phaeospirillum tilakii]|uniref:DUF2892 domain-containing protein n=1 Tax=Phaeospirillum tilakii TaxID=741673 RepID=A0ABW5C7X8_9PROT